MLDLDADDFLAMVRGSTQLYLVARDKHGDILLRSRLLLDTLKAGPELAQKAARQASALAPDFLKSCERDDHDHPDIIVT